MHYLLAEAIKGHPLDGLHKWLQAIIAARSTIIEQHSIPKGRLDAHELFLTLAGEGCRQCCTCIPELAISVNGICTSGLRVCKCSEVLKHLQGKA